MAMGRGSLGKEDGLVYIHRRVWVLGNVGWVWGKVWLVWGYGGLRVRGEVCVGLGQNWVGFGARQGE